MKYLLILCGIAMLSSCSKSNYPHSELTLTFVDSKTNEPVPDLSIEIEGLNYRQATGGTTYYTYGTLKTNSKGEILVGKMKRLNGLKYQVKTPFYDNTTHYIKTSALSSESNVIDIIQLARVNVSVYDDPEKHYDYLTLFPRFTRAENVDAELRIGQTQTITIDDRTKASLRVFYRTDVRGKADLEDFDLSIDPDGNYAIEVGI